MDSFKFSFLGFIRQLVLLIIKIDYFNKTKNNYKTKKNKQKEY